MPTPSELLDALASTIAATREHYADLDAAEGKCKLANIQLQSALNEVNATLAQLETKKSELAQVEKTLQTKQHLVNAEAAKALQVTNRQIKERQDQLRELEVKVGALRGEQDNVVEGMRALQQRLRI